MTNTFTTTAWAFDGSGNNWVSYPKGFNAQGKGLENGLFKGGHSYSAQAGKTKTYANDDDWKDPKAVKWAAPTAFAYQADDYVVNNSTDTTGLKAMTGVEVVAIAPVDTTITTEWDAEAVADAVKTQVATFGKVSYGVKGTTTSKKVAYKAAALDKTLDAAFATEATHNPKFIDTTKDVAWYPTSSDPMDALIEEEDEMEAMMAKAKAAVTTDEWAMVLAKANGATQTEIAEAFGYCNNGGVSKKFSTIYKKVKKATGVAFVA
jgi:hypothetical protein